MKSKNLGNTSQSTRPKVQSKKEPLGFLPNFCNQNYSISKGDRNANKNLKWRGNKFMSGTSSIRNSIVRKAPNNHHSHLTSWPGSTLYPNKCHHTVLKYIRNLLCKHGNMHSWKWLSQRKNFLYSQIPKNRSHGTPHKATWRGTRVGQ